MAYLTDSSEDFLLMRVHLSKSADLGQVDVFPVAKGNNLIKGKYQIKAVLRDLILLQGSTVFWDLEGVRENGILMRQGNRGQNPLHTSS